LQCKITIISNFFRFWQWCSILTNYCKERRRSLCAKWIKGLEAILLKVEQVGWALLVGQISNILWT